MTTIEQQARAYTASDIRKWLASGGYLTIEQHNEFGRYLPTSNMGSCMVALADALKEIAELRAEVDGWRKIHARGIQGLMLLQDRRDLLDLSGLTCGDYLGDAVPAIVAEYDRLLAQVAELQPQATAWVQFRATNPFLKAWDE